MKMHACHAIVQMLQCNCFAMCSSRKKMLEIMRGILMEWIVSGMALCMSSILQNKVG